MTQPAPPTSSPQDPLAKAGETRVTLRSDLQVSRQVYQASPVYVVHDPVSFRSHRLTAFQYRILATLDPAVTLRQNYQRLLNKGEFAVDEESLFFDLVSSYARLGLIVLPGASGPALFQQHQKIRASRRRGKLLGFLFLQIPLVKPDRFLTRTVSRVSWLFTNTFLLFWLLGMAAAGFVIYSRFDDMIQPLNGILATKNLVFLWLAFVSLKVWHELGHGYACKVFGGFVPEMGTILIAGTPAAFVDATAAWSFPERRRRLVVMCGGMFFESLVFIPCVFIWAFSNSPMLASCAWQLVIMASLVTLLFNANPLMKFDGYFILSELIGIQNLRPKADAHIKGMLTFVLLGVRPRPTQDSLTTKLLLIAYGISAMIYKFFLVIGIAQVVAIKFPVVGIALAVFYVSTTVGSGVYRMTKFLLWSKDTEAVRGRARLVAALVLIGLPVAACIAPVPFGVVRQGLVGAEFEQYINVDAPGKFRNTLVVCGEMVDPATPLAQLRNDQLENELRVAEASLREAVLRWKVIHQLDPAEAVRQQATVREQRKQVREISRRVQSLSVFPAGSGRVARILSDRDRGQFLESGSPLAIVVNGRPVLRTWVNEDQLGSIQSAAGTEVTFRIPGRTTATYRGRIVSVEPAAEPVFNQLALTYVAGGEILIDPTTHRPLEPVFQINIEPAEEVLKLTEHGARVNVKLPRSGESIAAWTVRKCMRFVNRLLVA